MDHDHPFNIKHRTVIHLGELYAVVSGLALTKAIEKTFVEHETFDVVWAYLPYFVAYCATLIPIYHGALIHLDKTYLKPGATNPLPAAFITDWTLLFIEGCAIFVFATTISDSVRFSWIFSIILGFDTIWAAVATFGFSTDEEGRTAVKKWATINATAVALMIVFGVGLRKLQQDKVEVEDARWVIVLLIAVARTVIDYLWCHAFYFPVDEFKSKTPSSEHSTTLRLDA